MAHSEQRDKTDWTICDSCREITVEALCAPEGYRAKLSEDEDSGDYCQLCNNFYRERAHTLWRRQIDDTGPPTLCRESEPFNESPVPYILTIKGDPAEEFGIPAYRASMNPTSSEDAFDFIRSCVDECSKDHGCLSPSLDRILTASPARLLDLGALASKGAAISDWQQDLKLVGVDGQSPRYMTLSHCWGGDLPESCKTTRLNLASRLARIEHSSLPLNFQHAVQTARRLGVRYLWIDAFCIIQDDASDWATESLKMADIYTNSFLTIAATSSPDTNGGCFNRSSLGQDQTGGGFIVPVSGKLSDGRRSELHFWFPNEELSEPSPLQGSPLGERGWVFQERVLSRRVIHFTSSQLVWECWECFKMQDQLPFLRVYWGTEPVRSLAVSEEDMKNKEAFLSSIWHKWLIGTDYASRAFTKIDDRVTAASGVAKYLHRITGDEYIAGLWRSVFALGLAWKSRKHNDKVFAPPRRPTWSWASHDHQFYWDPEEFFAEESLSLAVVSLSYVDQRRAPFCPPSGGCVIMTGLTFRVAITGTKVANAHQSSIHDWGAKVHIDGSGIRTDRVYLDYPNLTGPRDSDLEAFTGMHSRSKDTSARDSSISMDQNNDIFGLIIGRWGCYVATDVHILLLRKKEGAPLSAYTRIGLCTIENDGDVESWQRNLRKETLQLY